MEETHKTYLRCTDRRLFKLLLACYSTNGCIYRLMCSSYFLRSRRITSWTVSTYFSLFWLTIPLVRIADFFHSVETSVQPTKCPSYLSLMIRWLPALRLLVISLLAWCRWNCHLQFLYVRYTTYFSPRQNFWDLVFLGVDLHYGTTVLLIDQVSNFFRDFR